MGVRGLCGRFPLFLQKPLVFSLCDCKIVYEYKWVNSKEFEFDTRG
jgi:hypothetical protein